jgi:hypothetical protein
MLRMVCQLGVWSDGDHFNGAGNPLFSRERQETVPLLTRTEVMIGVEPPGALL